MAYCTNCGKETSAKKVCEHCGVKKNKTHNFCEWCGTALDPNAKICPNCKEPKKSGPAIMRVLGYVFSVMCLMWVFSGYPVAGTVCFALVAILALPVTKKVIIKATHNNLNLRKILVPVRVIAVVVLFVIALSYVPVSEREETDSEINRDQASQSEEVELTEAEIEKIVGNALYNKISNNKNYRSSLDPGATKYKIASIEDEGDKYVVYGNGYFYDKYGKLCYPYSDDSGSYAFSFEVTINKATGKASSCKIK